VLLFLPLLIDSLLIVHCQGVSRSFKKPRQVQRFAILAINFLDIFHAYAMGGYWSYRFAPYCRIFIFISYSHPVMIRVRLIAKMLPELVPLLFLVFSFIFCGGWIAVLLFPQNTVEGQTYFAGLWNAMWSLLILITTANFPDVMMPAYKLYRSTFLFFLGFVTIGVFLLVNVVTAVVFNAFTKMKENFSKEKDQVKANSRKAAFKCLTDIDGDPDEIHTDLMKALMDELSNYHDVGHIGNLPLDTFLAKLDEDGSGTINFAEFEQVSEVVKKTYTRHTPQPPFLVRRWPSLETSNGWKILQSCVTTWDRIIVDIILGISCCMAFAESVQMGLLEAHVSSEGIASKAKGTDEWQINSFGFWNICITGVFILEVITKILAWGFDQYWSKLMNRYDFLITSTVTIVTVYALVPNDTSLTNTTLIRFGALCRVGRLLRLMMHANQTFRLTADTIMRIIPDFVGIFKLLFCAMYVFSFIGMQVFGGVINTDPNSPYSEAVAATDFATADYYANNFNDMCSGMVTLYELLVVNNWFEIVDGFTAAVGEGAVVFFIIWYIFGVLIILNIVVSFILNAFVDEFEQGELSVGAQKTEKATDGTADSFEGDHH